MRSAADVRTAVGLMLFAGAAGLASVAFAAEGGPPLRIGHYSSANGLAGFVLDRLGTPIKVRLDGSDEILALTAEPTGRDAVSLKRDDGRYLLRIEADGGMTLFAAAFRDGVKVIRDQSAEPLTIAPATRAEAEDKATSLARQLKRQSGAAVDIALEARALGKDSGAWSAMADAVTAVGIALDSVLADRLGREAVAAKLKRVIIRDSGHVAIKLVGQTLVVEIAADQPVIGRPSSGRLVSALGDLL
jgi:uncharacterized protein DUF4908